MRADKISISLLFIIILVFGAHLRLYNLEKIPNGLYVDEASTGYNAWSVLLTGKDEYGKQYPLAFRFFGSYTPPLYTYLTMIPISLYDLSVLSVRIVSMISGILLIPLIFLFLKWLKIYKNFSAVFGTLLFTISPWSIFYSRVGYEINLAFLFYCLGLLTFWQGLKSPKYLIFGLAFLSLSTNIYHSERLLAHLTLLVFIVVFKKYLFKKEYRKKFFLGLILYLLILIPQFMILFTPANTSRGLGLFYHQAIFRQAEKISILPVTASIPTAFLREFSAQYLSYFSPRNLFFQPDSDLQRSIPELSVFYPWMFLPYLIGLYLLMKYHKNPANKFILMLFLLAPIPASLTGDAFSTQRSLPLLLPTILIITLGIDQFLKYRIKKVWAVAVVVLSFVSIASFYRSYMILLPFERAKTWGYGYMQLAKEVKKRPDAQFVIDNGRIKPAYIELAFFLKLPPYKLQQLVDLKIKSDYYHNIVWDDYYNLGEIETRAIDWEKDIYKDYILVGDELAISKTQIDEHFLTPEFEIKDPIGEIVFSAYKTNPKKKILSTTKQID